MNKITPTNKVVDAVDGAVGAGSRLDAYAAHERHGVVAWARDRKSVV